MKALFLDVDGVLNSQAWMKRCAGVNLLGVDPEAVARVQEIVARTGAKVVLSSTWRLVNTLVGILLRSKVPVFDKTPDLVRQAGGMCNERPRSDEIEAWLAAHPEVTAWAILDDDEDAGYGACEPHFVQTNPQMGLDDFCMKRVIALLGE